MASTKINPVFSAGLIFVWQSPKKKQPDIVFASHGDYEEDRLTTLYLQELYGWQGQYMDLDQLRIVPEPVVENGEVIPERGLYDLSGRKIDVLYRQTYPIEHLVNDEDPMTKEKVGQMLMKLVEEKELAVLNPPSAFLLQSKAVMALIWGLIGIVTQVLAYWIIEYVLTPKTNLAKKVEEGNTAIGFSLFAAGIVVGLVVAGILTY